MKNNFLSLGLIILSGILISSCSIIEPTGGDQTFDFLDDGSKVNVVFDYEDVQIGEYKDEDEYVQERVDEKNADEKGSGDKWKESWYSQREDIAEPKFETLINKYNENGLDFSRDFDEAEYTLYIDVLFIEPGFNAGVVKKNALVNFAMKFLKTENMKDGDAKAEMEAMNVPSDQTFGPTFSVTGRLRNCYEYFGKQLGKYIADNKQ